MNIGILLFSIIQIAFEGCFHGNLEQVYKTMAYIEEQHKIKIDALVSCGDFQAIRNRADMYSMKCKEKYLEIGNFHEYYTGAKKAPYLTIFIGGNHEASNHNRELHFGGWAAPNIYFMGASNVITLKKGGNQIRLGGISGIYKQYDFINSKLENFPLDNSSIVSCFHQKQIDVLKLSQLGVNNPKPNVDVFLSHDWPTDVVQHGNVADLLRKKKFFADDVRNNALGSYPLNYLLKTIKPGHLHVKYTAVYPHQQNSQEDTTLFLALDKCLPNRDFLQIIPLGKKEWNLQSNEESNQGQNAEGVDNEEDDEEEIELLYDEEWLLIQKSTFEVFNYHMRQDFFNLNNNQITLKSVEMQQKIQDQIQKNKDYFKDKDLYIPLNFQITCKPYSGPQEPSFSPDKIEINNQTLQYLQLLGVSHERLRDLVFYDNEKPQLQQEQQNIKLNYNSNFIVKNKDEIDLNDFSDEENPQSNNQKEEEEVKNQEINIKNDQKLTEATKQHLPIFNQGFKPSAQQQQTPINNKPSNQPQTFTDPSQTKIDELPFL